MVKPSRSLWLVLAVVALGILSLDLAPASAAAGPNPGNLVYVAVTPCRMVNTGLAGGPLIAGIPRTFTFRGPTQNYTSQGGNAAGCGIPDLSGGTSSANLAKAVAVNIFAVSPAGDGDIRAWPSNQGVPLAAVLTYAHVGTLAFANGVILPMCTEVGAAPCASGDVTFRADFGNTNLIVDVVGYFTEATTPGSNSNAALGHSALSSNTTGTANTALGYFTLLKNTTGGGNTAIGSAALQYNTAGINNTAVGLHALDANTSSHNTAVGVDAMRYNTGGNYNTAVGDRALQVMMGGTYNAALGANAMRFNSAGSRNVAIGADALKNSSSPSNTAVGSAALLSTSTGNNNIGLGYGAGSSVTTGSSNIEIGHIGSASDNFTIRIGTSQDKTFIAGIRSKTTVNNDAIPVLIDSAGQLGTVSSSRRFKQDIVDIGDESAPILDLRPVKFRYKEQAARGDLSPQFGLIAEEVAEVFPDLVVYGKDGLPETVKYHVLVPLLLNELKKEHSALQNERDVREAQQRQIEQLQAEAADQRAATAALLRRVKALQVPPSRAPRSQLH